MPRNQKPNPTQLINSILDANQHKPPADQHRIALEQLDLRYQRGIISINQYNRARNYLTIKTGI